jgi:hypothetical protein
VITQLQFIIIIIIIIVVVVVVVVIIIIKVYVLNIKTLNPILGLQHPQGTYCHPITPVMG